MCEVIRVICIEVVLYKQHHCTPGRERIVPVYGGYLKNVIIVALVRG